MHLDPDRLAADWTECERCHQVERSLEQTDRFEHVGCGGHVVRFAIMRRPPDDGGDLAEEAAAFLSEPGRLPSKRDRRIAGSGGTGTSSW